MHYLHISTYISKISKEYVGLCAYMRDIEL